MHRRSGEVRCTFCIIIIVEATVHCSIIKIYNTVHKSLLYAWWPSFHDAFRNGEASWVGDVSHVLAWHKKRLHQLAVTSLANDCWSQFSSQYDGRCSGLCNYLQIINLIHYSSYYAIILSSIVLIYTLL